MFDKTTAGCFDSSTHAIFLSLSAFRQANFTIGLSSFPLPCIISRTCCSSSVHQSSLMNFPFFQSPDPAPSCTPVPHYLTKPHLSLIKPLCRNTSQLSTLSYQTVDTEHLSWCCLSVTCFAFYDNQICLPFVTVFLMLTVSKQLESQHSS